MEIVGARCGIFGETGAEPHASATDGQRSEYYVENPDHSSSGLTDKASASFVMVRF